MSFTHAWRVAALSWPLYAFALVAIVIAAVFSQWLVIAVAAWFSIASFLAFHWMFDRSPLLGGSWLRDLAPASERCVQITTLLDETTLPVGEVVDVYDPAVMTEPALARARRGREAGAGHLRAIESASADLVVIMLAAHEIRARAGRESLFREVKRIVMPEGRVVLVEHLRNIAALLAFGPGLFHFFPRREWLGLSDSAGFTLEREFAITPFVRVFVFHAL